MGSFKLLVLLFAILFLSPLGTFQSASADPTVIKTNTMYPIPDENAMIILQKGASFGGFHDTSGFYPAHNRTDGYVPSLWSFQLFSAGNGTIGLDISAHNCNVTVNSYNFYLTDMGNYFFKADSWLNYSVAGKGTQLLDYAQLSNSNNSNPTIYIDGVAKEQGDGWDWANFGLTVSEAISTVSIHQQDKYYEPPRNPPNLDLWEFVLYNALPLVVVIILIMVILLVYRRHRKTTRGQYGQARSLFFPQQLTFCQGTTKTFLLP